MAFSAHDLTLDSSTALHLNASAITATAAGTDASGTAIVIDLGAPNTYAKFAVVVDWTAIDVSSTNELYDMRLEGSTTSGFGTVYTLAQKMIGDSSVNLQPVDSTPTGRIVFYGDNVATTSATDAGSQIATQYLRIRPVMGGTTPSLTYKAWLVPMP